MRKKCKTCNCNSDGEHCVRHKPRKSLTRVSIKQKFPEKLYKDIQETHLMWQFFQMLWSEREHRCQSCGTFLGSIPYTYFFDHLLEKSKYPHLKFKKNNILLVCGDCHSKKTNGHPTPTHKEEINKAKEIFLNESKDKET